MYIAVIHLNNSIIQIFFYNIHSNNSVIQILFSNMYLNIHNIYLYNGIIMSYIYLKHLFIITKIIKWRIFFYYFKFYLLLCVPTRNGRRINFNLKPCLPKPT